MNHRQNAPDTTAPLALLCAAAAFIALPAVLIGVGLGRMLRTRKPLLFGAAVIGGGITALLYPSITAEISDAVDALGAPKRSPGASGMAEAVWPHVRVWWTLTLGCAPAIGLVAEAVRPDDVEEQVRANEHRREKQQQRREKRARKAIGLAKPSHTGPSFVLGRHLDGEKLLQTKRGTVALPLSRLERTTLVVGAPGSGKTETLLRIAHGAAAESDWSVFVLDAKGDPKTMFRFEELMQQAGRRTTLFPVFKYDGWRGSGREIASRLIELVDWAEEGGGTFYRDLSVNLVRLACTAPDGPPRSSRELLERLNRSTLTDLWIGHPESTELWGFKDEHVNACRQRYAAFFHAVNGELDGSFAFEDGDCAYIMLNELLYGEETSKLARFLLEDFKQYVAGRKTEGHQVLLIVDEFTAIATGERVARLVEIVRSYGASLVLAPQAYQGMGGEEAAARIINAAHTTFLHFVPDPDELVRAAGTRMEIESSLQHHDGRSLELGSARAQHQYKVAPNDVRTLKPGGCYVIGSGKAQKIQIAPTPMSPGLDDALYGPGTAGNPRTDERREGA